MFCQLALAGQELSTPFPTAQKLLFISTNLQEYKVKWNHPQTKEATLKEERVVAVENQRPYQQHHRLQNTDTELRAWIRDLSQDT